MRLKILNESNEIPFIIFNEDDNTGIFSQMTDYISNKGSNFWSWLTGGVAQNIDGKNATVTNYFGRTNPDGTAMFRNSTDSVVSNLTKQGLKVSENAKRSVMQKLSDWIRPAKDGNMEPFLKGKLDFLANFIQQNPQITAVGLAGAGLLGTYYLFKKFSKNKKLTPAEMKNAVALDNKNPNEIAQRSTNTSQQ